MPETKPAPFTFPVLVACGVGCLSLLTSVGTAYANHAVMQNKVVNLETQFAKGVARLEAADKDFRATDSNLLAAQADTRKDVAVIRTVMEQVSKDTEIIRRNLEQPTRLAGGRAR